MFIVLEGVDGSGKSSLAQSIADEVKRRWPNEDVRMLHAGPRQLPVLDEYFYPVIDYMPASGVTYVIDRWHYGEEVYGPLYRGGSGARLSEWRWIDLWLQSRGARVWEVTNTHDEILRRLQARGEDFLKLNDISYVIEGFSAVSEQAETFARQCTVDGDTNALVSLIIDDAQYAENRSSLILGMTSSYVGRTFSDPKIVLVGDKRGGTPPHKIPSSFAPLSTSSGDFLWGSLPKDLWGKTATINVNDDEYDLEQFFEWMGDCQFVALGRNAQQSLKKYDIEFGVVPHPQSIRRFYNSKQLEYGSIIRRAASERKDYGTWPKS